MQDSTRSPLGGYSLLRQPRYNQGTAFTLDDRRKLGIEGLLPPAVESLQTQIGRVHDQLSGLATDLQKYLLPMGLQSRNETLFYGVLMSNPAMFMPLVYTPTVGEACQKFDHVFRAVQIFETSLHVAVKVAQSIFDQDLARIPKPPDLEAHVRACAYKAGYLNHA